jgi:hypothetical protein
LSRPGLFPENPVKQKWPGLSFPQKGKLNLRETKEDRAALPPETTLVMQEIIDDKSLMFQQSTNDLLGWVVEVFRANPVSKCTLLWFPGRFLLIPVYQT